MVKDEVGSVDGFGGIAQKTLNWCKNTAWKGSKV